MTEQEWNPGSLLKLSGSYWQTCALHTAVKLDLFTVIGTEEINATKISKRTGLDEGALTRLLDALTAMRLLFKAKNRYQNTPAARKFLSAGSKS